MDNKYKTREQLTIELQELLNENNTLKALMAKQADELLISEENLSITLNSIGDGVISTDNNGFIVHLNPMAEKLCGWKLADATGKPLAQVFNIVNSESRKTVDDPVKKVLKNGEIVGLANHTVLISKNGNEYQIADSAAPIKTKEGVITGVVLVFSDVTEKYRFEDTLQESENNLRTLFNAMKDVVFELDYDGRYISVAPTAADFLSKTPEDVIGKTLHEIFPKPEADKFLEFVRKSLDENKETTLEYPMLRNDKTIWFEGRAIPKTKSSILYIARDITQRKLAVDTLRESEEKYRTIFNANNDSISIFGAYPDGTTSNFLEFNDATTKMFNRTREELMLMNIKDFEEDITEEARQQKIEMLQSKGSFSIETSIKDNTGNIKIIDVKGILINYRNKPAIMNIARDITKRKQAEDALMESEKKYRLISENTLETVWTTDINFKTVFINNAVLDFIGYTPEEVLDMHSSAYITEEGMKTIQNEVEKFMTDIEKGQLKQANFEVQHIKKDGSVIDVEIRANIMFDDNNNIIGFQGRSIDITEKKKMIDELIIAKEKAQESDRLKSAFLANMSHEIRTPMNGILGFAELLKQPNLTGDEQQKYINIIEKGGIRMLNIINDIVSISTIESGLMKVNLQESNINEQIEYIYTFFKPEVEAKGMTLYYKNTLPAKYAIISTDREKLFAILTNLVKNAIKYSSEGSIEIGCKIVVETIHESSLLQFYVKDTGIGIAKNRQTAIFERFIQADIEDKHARQGAGLGLSITKAYIEMLGGKIWVESEEGIGSTFYFTLPYNSETQEKTNARDTVLVSDKENKDGTENLGLKVLIAEDDEASESFIEIVVKKLSKQIIKVNTGVEAIEVCKNNPDIDLILMDIQMPDMNGYEATKEIRQFNKDVVIIAQTAFGLSGDREKSLDAGCNDYISKPINKNELLTLIQMYFRK